MDGSHLYTVSDLGLEPLLDELLALRAAVLEDAETRLQKYRARSPAGAYSRSALNLAYYLSLRKHDLRKIQERLSEIGLSSLGRGEAHILANLDRVIGVLCRLVGGKRDVAPAVWSDHVFNGGERILSERANRLCGPEPEGRPVRIMVTLPSAAAGDRKLADALVGAGMNIARINCAHDDAASWENMVANVRRAESRHGRRCAILMDLAGPKARTTNIISGAPVKHIKVAKDDYGKAVSPATVALVPESMRRDGAESQPPPAPYEFTIPDSLHANLTEGDRLEFEDTRGKRRYLEIAEKADDGMWRTRCHHSAYLTPDMPLCWMRRDSQGQWQRLATCPLGAFTGLSAAIRLAKNDLFFLMNTAERGRPAVHDDNGRLIEPARIGCTLPEAVNRLLPGHTVWIDDGRLGAVVKNIYPQGALLHVTHTGPRGLNIRAGKGLNFPDTDLDLPPLTDQDIADLDFVCRHADMVGYSFVQTIADMDALIHQLSRRGAAQLPVIAKIESKRAVANLPEILLGTMDRHPLGVMIARGDLAIELGSVRFAEIQEELLWVCEAAHVPVVWATQVLESLAKHGVISRPEITDAAMSVRAECVMLNKGPYTVEAVEVMSDILGRMQDHRRKKSDRLRVLHLDY